MAKKIVNFTVDENLLKDFKIIANDNAINMSRYIEKCIEDFIKKFKSNEENL